MRLNLFCLFAGLLGLSACTTPPTIVNDVPSRQMSAAEQMLAPIQVTKETIVVDARSRFEYSISHIPGSVNLQWSDFTEPERAQKGVVQNDTFAIARRLAHNGIGPDTPVVVVGRGKNGDGEEGRLAWMLAYLGVKHVQFADVDSFHVHFSNVVENNPPAEVPIWKPEIIESLNVPRTELQLAMNKHATTVPLARRTYQPARLYRIIDVRNGKDYMGMKGFGKAEKIPNMDAINIPWGDFFTKDLRPNPKVKEELAKVGVTPDQRILVIDESGVSSGAATMALRAFGYDQAGNYAGGLTDLLSAYR